MARYTRIVVLLALSLALAACPTTPKPPAETVAAPAFSPAEGTFTSAQPVTLVTSTAGAEIRYTTDSSAPSPTAGTVYSAPIAVSATTTIRAMAWKAGMQDSPVVSATFTITGTVADVQFNPAGGTYDAAQTVALATSTDGAQIYYTTDGSEPTANAGIPYAGPVSVGTTQTLSALAVKKDWASSAVTRAAYTITTAAVTAPVATPVTDAEVDEARNAIARAREVDADYFDPDNFNEARRLFDEGFQLKTNDPGTARERLGASKEAADLSYANAVQRAAQVMAANLEAARARLLALQADKYMPGPYADATGGIDAAAALYAAQDYSGARARAYQALKDMADLATLVDTRVRSVRALKAETEQAMKDAETSNAYAYAPDAQAAVSKYYLAGVDAWNGWRLDPAEENFGAALEAARDALAAAKTAQDTTVAAEKAKAEALQKQVMDALIEASKLTVVTDDGTVITPRNWTEEEFLREIDRMIQEEQAAPSPTSLAVPGDGDTVVLEEDAALNLLQQARDLWAQGLKEKAAGNYARAQDYFAEAQRYIDVYKSYAVKGVYTVRLIPDRRDCLWRIAEYPEIYGDPYKWPSIWRRNRKLIQNPDLIYPGWQLVIPPE